MDNKARVTLVADNAERMAALQSSIEADISVTTVMLLNAQQPPSVADLQMVWIDLRSPWAVKAVRSHFKRHPGTSRLFAVEPADRQKQVQSHSAGATGQLALPLDPEQIRRIIKAHHAAPGGRPVMLPKGPARSVAQSGSALEDAMSATKSGGRIDVAALTLAGSELADVMRETPLDDWLRMVRQSHDGTYEHCLTVAGVLTAFAIHVGFSGRDVSRLAACALAHDVGKCFVPRELLDKPGALEPWERKIIQRHPGAGHEVLKNSGADPLILEATLNHHEYLDGTGYPNGLSGSAISDVVRMLTIADVFTALVERRSYKLPMPADKAYSVLESMDGKLDAALVKSFAPVAQSVQTQINRF